MYQYAKANQCFAIVPYGLGNVGVHLGAIINDRDDPIGDGGRLVALPELLELIMGLASIDVPVLLDDDNYLIERGGIHNLVVVMVIVWVH